MSAFLDLAPENYQLAPSHSEDIQKLDQLLGNVLERVAGKELVDLARKLYENQDDVAPTDLFRIMPQIRDPIVLQKILRAYTILFQLLNLTEQKEIIRVNRMRQQSSENPRKESILDTFTQLKKNGVAAQSIQDLLNRLDICPTLTAHPTEARRRAVLDKLESIAHMLFEIKQSEAIGKLDKSINYQQYLEEDLERLLTSLWLTEELNRTEITVRDESQNAVYFIEHTIFDLVVWLYRDVRYALKKVYPEDTFDIPIFLKYRSWVGGDRDGNPKVTPDVTWQTLLFHRRKILEIYIHRVNRLIQKYTHSDRLIPASRELRDSLEAEKERIAIPQRILQRFQHEPYALKLMYIRRKLKSTLYHMKDLQNLQILGEYDAPPPTAYSHWKELLEDLILIQSSFAESGMDSLAYEGSLADLIIQVKTFGFHLAALDIRQHSSVHEEVLDEMFRAAHRLPPKQIYSELSEEEKIELLTQELNDPRPLLPRFWQGSETATNLLQVFEVIRHSQHILSEESVQSYIVSMTHSISDVLEVLVLAKETGLVRLKTEWGEQVLESDLDVVPLFETIDDLERSEGLMRQLFENPLYFVHLKKRNNFQEIMLGYSDSSKDGGYMSANWSLHNAQQSLSEIGEEFGVDIRFFHGRGGTVGRGGGRAYLAIRTQPPHSLNGKIRFTEQGEIISFRYSFAPIAHRHLEQIVGAVLLASNVENHKPVRDEWNERMQAMADFSRDTYRSLIYENEDFFPFYVDATPISYISQLPIASRPVSRTGGSMVGMEDLRAIPWVFAWVQSRYLVPGWYGVGSALEHLAGENEENLPMLREMYKHWNLFQLVLDNAKIELLRTHLPTASWYASRVESEELRGRLHGMIEAEFIKTEHWIQKIREGNEHTHFTIVKHTIDFRNPIVAVLNKLQVALLDVCDPKKDVAVQDEEQWKDAMLLSLTGVAAAMQSTG